MGGGGYHGPSATKTRMFLLGRRRRHGTGCFCVSPQLLRLETSAVWVDEMGGVALRSRDVERLRAVSAQMTSANDKRRDRFEKVHPQRAQHHSPR